MVVELHHVHRIATDDRFLERQRLVQAAERREQISSVAEHVEIRRIERERALVVLRRHGQIVVTIAIQPNRECAGA